VCDGASAVAKERFLHLLQFILNKHLNTAADLIWSVCGGRSPSAHTHLTRTAPSWQFKQQPQTIIMTSSHTLSKVAIRGQSFYLQISNAPQISHPYRMPYYPYHNGLYAQLHYFLNFSQLLVPVCHYWSNWLIQVYLTSVVMATTIRHTWINQFGQ